MTTPSRHAAPATWWTRIADVLHRKIVKHFPRYALRPTTGAHVYRARSAKSGLPRMTLAHTLTKRVRTERLQHAALAQLRTECERMAHLLDGCRRGDALARTNAGVRATIKRETARTLHRVKAAARVPARTRFAHAGTAVRTAARETAAVAAHTVRQVGAHRHVRGVNDAAHGLATTALARIKAYGAQRAVGENSIWTTPRGLPA